VWCELMTTDLAGAESFYKNVVGWTAVPFAPDGSYVVFNNPSGAGSAGMMTLADNAKQNGVPPHWLMYVGTPSVDDTAQRVAQLGGRVLKQPEDIPNTGRFAVVQDPYGAMFGIYSPPPGRPGKGPVGVGDFSWFELYTPNPDGAWRFYSTLFGWEKTSAMDMGEGVGMYQMFGRGGGIPNGGIMKPPPGAPAAWQPYAMVKDAKAAAATATTKGGKIVTGPMEVPGGDWIAVGIDPQGAMFAVHSLNPANRQAAAAKTATPRKTAMPPKKTAAKKATPTKKARPATRTKAKKSAKAKPVRKAAKPVKKKAAKKKAASSSAKARSSKSAKKAAKRKK